MRTDGGALRRAVLASRDSKEMLFIGGCMDGKIVEVHRTKDELIFAERPKNLKVLGINETAPMASFEHTQCHIYRRREFHGFEVFAMPELSDQRIMGMLLERYRKSDKENDE